MSEENIEQKRDLIAVLDGRYVTYREALLAAIFVGVVLVSQTVGVAMIAIDARDTERAVLRICHDQNYDCSELEEVLRDQGLFWWSQ